MHEDRNLTEVTLGFVSEQPNAARRPVQLAQMEPLRASRVPLWLQMIQNLNVCVCAAFRIEWSTRTNAAIASRWARHGEHTGIMPPGGEELRGLALDIYVGWGRRMVAVGLKATRKQISSPLLMPPCTPPLRLVGVRTRPSRFSKRSLC